MSKHIIGCDVDGVLTDLYAHNIREGRKVFRREPFDPAAYDLDKMFDVSGIPKPIRYAKAFGIYCRYCKNEPQRDGAARVISELSRQGFEFHAITSRLFAFNRNLFGKIVRGWLTDWLSDNNISFRKIHLCRDKSGPKDKLYFCKMINVEIMIEDKPENALYLAQNGILVLLFDAPYNRDLNHKNITRVHSWEEIRNNLYSMK